jgi:tRNA pseudouridine32 synthase/23S rRNA pseudouridine746 synthase
MSHPVEIEILYRDEALLVVNKPAGLSTLPDGYDPSLPHIKSVLEHQYGRLWIVHRLDKYTSGVLLLARSAAAHRSLNNQFEQHQVRKVYHALVSSIPEWQETTIALPLKPNGDRHHRTVVDLQHGKPARTHFRLLERFDRHSLLEAIPETGRTHQIRAHLSSADLFIVGDQLYSPRLKSQDQRDDAHTHPDGNLPSGLVKGMALHALSIECKHPLTGEPLEFSAPYPAAIIALLEYLRATSHAN